MYKSFLTIVAKKQNNIHSSTLYFIVNNFTLLEKLFLSPNLICGHLFYLGGMIHMWLSNREYKYRNRISLSFSDSLKFQDLFGTLKKTLYFMTYTHIHIFVHIDALVSYCLTFNTLSFTYHRHNMHSYSDGEMCHCPPALTSVLLRDYEKA